MTMVMGWWRCNMFRDLNPLDLVMEDTPVGLSPIQVASTSISASIHYWSELIGYGVIGSCLQKSNQDLMSWFLWKALISLECSLFYKINSTYAGLGSNVSAMFPPAERNPRPSLHLRLWLPALLPQVQQHEVECQVYQRAGRLAGSLVGPIRLLHAMKDPAQSERLTRMMDHVEGMRKETGRLLRSMSSSRSSVWESPSQRSIFM